MAIKRSIQQGGPNPTRGVQDSAEHGGRPMQPVSPRRMDTSQDFGDREVTHTAQDLPRADDSGTAEGSSTAKQSGGAPGHGTPRHSPEEKRSWNPD